MIGVRPGLNSKVFTFLQPEMVEKTSSTASAAMDGRMHMGCLSILDI
jgi:hypothetical protein